MNLLNIFRKELQTTLGKVVFLGIILAFFLAVIPLLQQLFFYYDQARDAYEAYNIWHLHDLKILGPSTDIPFLHHGVLWYYLLAILYGIFQKNPSPVAIVFLTAFFLTLPAVWCLGNELFKDKKIAAIALILYAFSPLFQLSTRWLSNPILSLISMPFLLLILWRYINKQKLRTAFLVGVIYGITIQSQLAFAILLIFIPIYFIVFKLKINLKHISVFLVGLLITSSSIILGEVKYHFQGITSLINFISSPHNSHQSLLTLLQTALIKTNDLLRVSILPLGVLLPIIIFIILFGIMQRKNNKDTKPLIFILIWLSNLLIFCLFDTGISRSLFVYFPSLTLVTILTSYLLVKVITQKYLLIIVVIGIIISQIWLNLSWIKNELNPLTVQMGMTLNKEKEVIDYTYNSADKKPFSINTVTEPLFINTTWAYLYNFYGQKKFSYLPYWSGKDQAGNLGELPESQSKTQYEYLIIEPTTGIPEYFIKSAISEEDARSKVIEEKRIGNFIVQKRVLLDQKN